MFKSMFKIIFQYNQNFLKIYVVQVIRFYDVNYLYIDKINIIQNVRKIDINIVIYFGLQWGKLLPQVFQATVADYISRQGKGSNYYVYIQIKNFQNFLPLNHTSYTQPDLLPTVLSNIPPFQNSPYILIIFQKYFSAHYIYCQDLSLLLVILQHIHQVPIAPDFAPTFEISPLFSQVIYFSFFLALNLYFSLCEYQTGSGWSAPPHHIRNTLRGKRIKRPIALCCLRQQLRSRLLEGVFASPVISLTFATFIKGDWVILFTKHILALKQLRKNQLCNQFNRIVAMLVYIERYPPICETLCPLLPRICVPLQHPYPASWRFLQEIIQPPI